MKKKEDERCEKRTENGTVGFFYTARRACMVSIKVALPSLSTGICFFFFRCYRLLGLLSLLLPIVGQDSGSI
jgi:hypothetical protein